MDGESTVLGRIFHIIPPGVFGLLSVVAGVIGDLISASLFPGYNITVNMISDLGVGPGALFFNMGVILSGLIGIPYLIHLGKTLFEQNMMKSATEKVAITGSIISSVTLSLIGVFPANRNNYSILLIHGTIATICYLGAVIYLSIYGKCMLRDDRFSKSMGYVAFITAGCFIIVLLTWLPLIQWIANIAIILWTTLVAAYILKNKI